MIRKRSNPERGRKFSTWQIRTPSEEHNIPIRFDRSKDTFLATFQNNTYESSDIQKLRDMLQEAANESSSFDVSTLKPYYIIHTNGGIEGCRIAPFEDDFMMQRAECMYTDLVVRESRGKVRRLTPHERQNFYIPATEENRQLLLGALQYRQILATLHERVKVTYEQFCQILWDKGGVHEESYDLEGVLCDAYRMARQRLTTHYRENTAVSLLQNALNVPITRKAEDDDNTE